MKEWKKNVVDAIAEKAEEVKIVIVKEVAASLGFNHISAQDTRDILIAAAKRLPDYRPVRFIDNPNASLFQSLAFIQNDVEFQDWEEEA